MPRNQHWKRTSINNPQSLHAVHPRVTIEHGHYIATRPHFTRTRGMVERHDCILNDFENLAVG